MTSEHINAIVFCLDCRQVFNMDEHVECLAAMERVDNQPRLEFDDE